MISMLLFTACKSKKNDIEPTDPRLADIKLPPGFHITYFAEGVDSARSMALGDKGTVFLGSKNTSKVFALADEDHDGKADRKYVICNSITVPNGVAFYKGDLYIAGIDKIWKLENIEENLVNPPQPIPVFDKLPGNYTHGWKYIAFGPDGKLYIPIGMPCNVCDSNVGDERFGTITRINPDGSAFEIYAKGIRNTVGFSWHPKTKELWFTENGRDLMGDNTPPDELDRAPVQGMNFGFPYCHGGDIPDPVYGSQHDCSEFTPPIAKLSPHVAALGMKFYTGNMFPIGYKNNIFIAEHGSWNRTEPIGYRVMLVRLNGNEPISYEVFADGWLNNGKRTGRPVDILQLNDGSLLVSDDYAACIYRVTYSK